MTYLRCWARAVEPTLALRFRVAPGFIVLGAFAVAAVLACSDETFTPDECKELPQYDIRQARRSGGAVQRSGTIGGSPLSAEAQRELQRLAAQGCVTLPSKEYSLEDRESDRDGG
jgi:hypothetical protein